jgi:SAM-dependent methyltransferase
MYRLSEVEPPGKDYGVSQAVEHILASRPDAEILVIGSGDTTIAGRATYTDVAFGANVQCIADAHDLPFVAQSFDACIAVAVLEHVADPYRCVDEMRRVLRPGGFVFAETPFMQPVHMRQHDFTRFTYLGHRRLFRHFDDIRSGIAGGPGTSAGQLLRYAITAVSDKPRTRKWLKLVGLLVTWPVRWLDHLSYSKLGAYDSASGFYFFGTLREQPIADRDLLQQFRGS